jgi:hypothetical protein
VRRLRRLVPAVAAAALVAAGVGTAFAALRTPQTCGDTGSVTTTSGTLTDGAKFKIKCPPGAQDRMTASWLLSQGFALAGSSYAATGWAIQQALPDQIATKQAFSADFGAPRQTVAWGASLGGMVTAGLIQDFPGQCGAAALRRAGGRRGRLEPRRRL